MTAGVFVASHAPGRAQAVRGPAFWILVALVVFGPLPLGGVGAVWTYVYGLLVAVALLSYLLERRRRGRALPPIPWPLGLAGALVALVACWGLLQSSPGWFAGSAHPVWAVAGERLGTADLVGALSVAPERGRLVALAWFGYLGFGLLVLWLAWRSSHRDFLLKLFLGVQAVYALYGLAVYFAGNATILWFEKTSYQDVLTSTFVNRNSYATYLGLGVLTALALILRYLRRALSDERSERTQMREFIETFTGRGWLVPMVLLLCFVALLLTGSRMGLTACLVGACVLLVGWTGRLAAGRARTFGTGLLGLLVGLLVLNFVLSGGLTLERFERLFTDGDGRFLVYPLMLEAIESRPLTGHGLGAFESAFRLVRDARVSGYFDLGHSDYLELVMSVGWPAALAVFLAFGLGLGLAWRISRRCDDYEYALLAVAATVQVAVHAAVDFSLQIPAVMQAYLLVVLAGVSGPMCSSRSNV